MRYGSRWIIAWGLINASAVQISRFHDGYRNDFLVYFRTARRFLNEQWNEIYNLADGAFPYRYFPGTLPWIAPLGWFEESTARIVWCLTQAAFFFAGAFFAAGFAVVVFAAGFLAAVLGALAAGFAAVFGFAVAGAFFAGASFTPAAFASRARFALRRDTVFFLSRPFLTAVSSSLCAAASVSALGFA
jgi:hypothetical protein